jgi:hypothetical protein
MDVVWVYVEDVLDHPVLSWEMRSNALAGSRVDLIDPSPVYAIFSNKCLDLILR